MFHRRGQRGCPGGDADGAARPRRLQPRRDRSEERGGVRPVGEEGGDRGQDEQVPDVGQDGDGAGEAGHGHGGAHPLRDEGLQLAPGIALRPLLPELRGKLTHDVFSAFV